jgi:hypothetical protein
MFEAPSGQNTYLLYQEVYGLHTWGFVKDSLFPGQHPKRNDIMFSEVSLE